MKEKFSPEGIIQACFTTISLTYHLFWKKKEKENKYKVEKHHIYNTVTPIYTIIDSKKNIYKTIQLENCAIKQRKIKLKFKESQKIT